jgi:HPt (histidine-containing phosphotransfer) domain-containing protein
MSLKYESFQDLVKVAHQMQGELIELKGEKKILEEKIKTLEAKISKNKDNEVFSKNILDKLELLLKSNDILESQFSRGLKMIRE